MTEGRSEKAPALFFIGVNMFQKWNKIYVVLASDETCTVFEGRNASLSYDINGLTKFDIDAEGTVHQFARLNKCVPITEAEIAGLICQPDEELEEIKE